MSKNEHMKFYRIQESYYKNVGMYALGILTKDEFHKRNKELCERLDELEKRGNYAYKNS